jgi:hypothetical protein
LSDKRKIYWNGLVPEKLKGLLADSETVLTQKEGDKASSALQYGTGDSSNVFFEAVNWENVKSSPCAFVNEDLLEWDIPKLVLKRFFAGEGSIGPEESYQGVLLKSNTLKIIDSNSIGYYSDVITASASEANINPVRVRSFTVTLLTYLDYLKRSELISFPIELDYGISQDSFFIQAHCENNGVVLENILDSVKDPNTENPFECLVKESLVKTDLLEAYTLKSSNKLVITGCWIGNPNFIRKHFFSSLLIYQIDSYRQSKHINGNVVESQPFFDQSLADLSKIKMVGELPKKYQKQEGQKHPINPVLVKRVSRFIIDKWSNNNKEIPLDYNTEFLKRDVEDFPDKEAISRLNSFEELEILKVLAEGLDSLERDVDEIKRQIKPDDYLDGILETIGNISAEQIAAISGTPEDLTEATTMVSGTPEDLTEATTMVSGTPEDLTEATTMVSGTPEDLTENREMIKGEVGALDKDKKIIKSEVKEEKEKIVKIGGDNEVVKNEAWELKRLAVVNKVKKKIDDLQGQGLNNDLIDEQVKQIFAEELGVDENVGQNFVKTLSDDVSDGFVKDGLDAVSENIRQRIKNEKISNQLSIRDRQVSKMKELIVGLKQELTDTQDKLSIQSENMTSAFPAVDESFSSEVVDHGVESNEVELNEADKDREELKVKNIESGREVQKLKNEVVKLEADNQLLLKKIKEGLDQVNQMRESGEDARILQGENENLKLQVESLKKRLSFAYENSKENEEVSLSANEVQKIVDDKERFFAEKMKQKEENDFLKSEVREKERLLKQAELEAEQQVKKMKNIPVGNEETILLEKDKEIQGLKVDLKKLSDESKASQLKTKSFEQKVKFLNAQLEKFQNRGVQSQGKVGPVVDAKIAGKLKQSELLNRRLKDVGEKLKSQLGEKRAELHKVKLESQALSMKFKELERKMAALTKKNAA